MKKSKVFLALAAVLLVVLCCSVAGCTTSEPDPIIGTFVYSQYSPQQWNSTPGVDVGHPVGGITNSASIWKFNGDGTGLHCSIADKRVIHSYYKWNSIGNLTYLVTEDVGTDEFILDNSYNELVLSKVNENIRNGPSYFRNDSYLIPEPFDPFTQW